MNSPTFFLNGDRIIWFSREDISCTRLFTDNLVMISNSFAQNSIIYEDNNALYNMKRNYLMLIFFDVSLDHFSNFYVGQI